jgi:hypothetical protein
LIDDVEEFLRYTGQPVTPSHDREAPDNIGMLYLGYTKPLEEENLQTCLDALAENQPGLVMALGSDFGDELPVFVGHSRTPVRSSVDPSTGVRGFTYTMFAKRAEDLPEGTALAYRFGEELHERFRAKAAELEERD